MHDKTKCEYCGDPLPLGVDKRTRQQRTHHFQVCLKKPQMETQCEQPPAISAPEIIALQEENASLCENWKDLRAILERTQRELNELRAYTRKQ